MELCLFKSEKNFRLKYISKKYYRCKNDGGYKMSRIISLCHVEGIQHEFQKLSSADCLSTELFRTAE